MDMCICGHSDRQHDQTGECRAAGCRCKHFKPEIALWGAAATWGSRRPGRRPPADCNALNHWMF